MRITQEEYRGFMDGVASMRAERDRLQAELDTYKQSDPSPYSRTEVEELRRAAEMIDRMAYRKDNGRLKLHDQYYAEEALDKLDRALAPFRENPHG